MVMARLHIICGNCGCNDSFTWKHTPKEFICDECGDLANDEDVHLSCGNCATIHSLSQNAKLKETQSG